MGTLLTSNSTPEYLQRSFEQFPLAHKAGLITCLDENKFNLKEIAITDISYQGILPKSVVKILLKSKESIIAKNLLAVFILRSICMQKALVWLIKDHLETIKVNEV
jgi:hypothetical protein